MKCTNCGHEMPANAKFCEMCGTPADIEQTQLAEDDIRDDYNNFNARENNIPQGGYVNSGYPDRPYDDRYPDDRRYYSDAPGYNAPRYDDPRYNDPNLYPRDQKPRMSGQKKALIISGVALVLVIAILTGVIVYVSRTKVSAKELDEAKENFLPPAQAYEIDTTLDDPSNDNIKFKYDSRARISSCTYAVNEKTYDQSYGYNDKSRIIKIDTKYRSHTIFTKEIEYDRIDEANKFVAVDGYYIRLDDTSLGNSSSSSAVKIETAAPEPTTPRAPKAPKAPTEPPTPTEKPAPTVKVKETEKPLEGYKKLYINFLNTTSISYDYGVLIYLNDDETPELVLYASGAEVPHYVCYIKNSKVQTFKTADSHSLDYTDHGGYFSSGKYDQTGMIYYFDGSSVTTKHSYSFSFGNDEFFIDDNQLTEEEYFEIVDGYGLKTDAEDDACGKSDLTEYIRNFE